MKANYPTLRLEIVSQGADPVLSRVRESLGYPHILRLVLSILILGAAVITLRVVFGDGMVWRHVPVYILLQLCGTLITGGIIYCLWVQYCVSGERWILLASVAFGGLMLGQLLHAFSLASTFSDGSGLRRLGEDWYTAWRLASAAVLLYAAWVHTVQSRQGLRRQGLRTAFGYLAFLTCAVVLVLNADKVWSRVAYAIPSIPATVVNELGAWPHYSFLAGVLYLAILLAACVVFIGRYKQEEDAFSGGITKFLLLSAGGQAALLVSSGDYTMTWWMSSVLVVAALGVLLFNLGMKFSASYADAHARIEHLEAVHYMSSRLSDTLDLRVVLLALVSDTASMLSARFASVMLSDDEGESLVTVVTHGLTEDPLSPSKPQGVTGTGRPDFYSGHTARAFRNKRICVVDDVYTDVEFVPWRQLASCDGYTVSVPLIYREIPLGVMNLFFDKHVPLNDERIRLFETLASSAAVSIMNAQLYDRTTRRDSEMMFTEANIKLAS